MTQCLPAAWFAGQHTKVGKLWAWTTGAVHWGCITAHLHEQQSSIGVFALTQGCCQPGLQSSTEQRGSYFALNSGAVHWCCITSHLHEEQTSIGVFASTQCCCLPGLQSSTEQGESHFAWTSAAVHLCSITAHLHEEQISVDVLAVTQSLLSAWFAGQHAKVGKLWAWVRVEGIGVK